MVVLLVYCWFCCEREGAVCRFKPCDKGQVFKDGECQPCDSPDGFCEDDDVPLHPNLRLLLHSPCSSLCLTSDILVFCWRTRLHMHVSQAPHSPDAHIRAGSSIWDA